MDPRDLNEALEMEPYHTRSVDEITAKLQGMTVFAIVDFKKGYWMVVLHPDSRKLTCMALPSGRFQSSPSASTHILMWSRHPLCPSTRFLHDPFERIPPKIYRTC